MFRYVLERGNHSSDDVTRIIMFAWKTGKSQVIAKVAFYLLGFLRTPPIHQMNGSRRCRTVL